MSKHISLAHFALATPFARPRGILSARADATTPNAILAELQVAVQAMRTEHEKELADIRKGLGDVVQTEKVERINTEISALTRSLDEVNTAIAALRLGGGGEPANPARRAHSEAFGRWFRRGTEANLRELEVQARLTTQSDPDGGYLVPEEISTTIDRVQALNSVMRQLATVMQIGTDTYRKFFNLAGTGSGWVGEEEARPETGTPTLAELIFSVMEIYANPQTTQRMLDDGIIDIASWLADEVTITFGEQEGTAFIAGQGNKRPRGILAYNTVANSAYTWGNVGYVPSGAAASFAATAPGDAFIDLYYALKTSYRNNASWLTSDANMNAIRKFKDGQGNYLWAPPATSADVPTILGKPVYNDDNMPVSTTAGNLAVAFADFKRAYLILDRLGIRVLRDPFTNKPNVSFYTTKRVGGGIANFEAIKLMKIGVS